MVYAPDESGLMVAAYAGFNDSWEWEYGWGALNAGNSWAVSPVYSDYFYFFNGTYFSQGLWTVSRNGEKWGAVNTSGQEVIPLEYDAMTAFKNDLAAVEKDGKWYYVDMHNNTYQIGTPEGGVASNITIASQFSDNIAAVYDGKRAYCIVNTPVDGVLPAIQGTEGLAASVYFPDYEEYLETGEVGTIVGPDKYVAIERDGKWGFLKLTFELEGVNPFEDVHIGDYYYDPVQWAVENEITVGTSSDTFSPKDTCTHAQILTFLWRAAGSPAAAASSFNDVPASAGYAEAVAWAVQEEITAGTGGGNFSPDQICARGQIVTFLYRDLAED